LLCNGIKEVRLGFFVALIGKQEIRVEFWWGNSLGATIWKTEDMG